ncbi:MAG: hypothetical protein B7Z60_02055 [Ferrovum sp. 37-45-19]|uniref:DUF3047 domain-containing protein n=1 Tax=Ferrovum sp. JA12 TaxID=1356299 RepID=UPI000702CBF5|nr:DUF3047 domain-containing protein [Ferrovum sp. JA12]OYV79421.1 MAG: hypothetical protein B7Z65_06205 [Ferrovum sp. 21-44-67]OYV95000.1 MAG: hypothetical protein B7Z60_02055 [Ferrovum sp. 37-45-19]OZB34243.1 MAG: hypothetical protein B7X47_01345 [Ferrovum sp. 34-44-207]HQT80945.1 DUF3047 domain-containing protein [Ferrovaceae bacterium]KRH78787.1 hypothetical protein FERRO_17830 [Ferrovum sp. JA12]
MSKYFYLLFFLVFFIPNALAASVVELPITPTPSNQWQIIRFDRTIPPTLFSIRHWDGKEALQAEAKSSMAVYSRNIDINIQRTPYLCWYWRVNHVVDAANMGTKEGDDYAARIYLTFSYKDHKKSWLEKIHSDLTDLFKKNNPDMALNYVWDNKKPINYREFSPFVSVDSMIVVESGNQKNGQWILEKRNLLTDLQQSFKTTNVMIQSIGLASDTDNTHSEAQAGFAGIVFVDDPNLCH